ncbi:MAG TPA: FAD-binding protein [Myxococcales bacterium]|nr:FAD-binding protein [Myxococcales bacterium]
MKRVLVIGGGMAGAAAAFAAREAGAEVTLAARAPGATALCGGLIEVAADPLGRALPAREAADGLAARAPGHPYAALRARLGDLEPALALVGRRLAPFLVKGPALLATTLGGVRAGAWAHASHAAGALVPGRRYGVCWFPRQPALLDGPAVAAALQAAGVAAEPSGVDWLDREERLGLGPFDLARLFDRPSEVRSLGASLARARGSADVLLLPPVIGFEKTGEALHALSSAVGAPCAELVAATPSIPGARLQGALDRALEQAGVEVRRGVVTRLAEGRAEVTAATGTHEVPFDGAVLATGRFIGGGIRRDAAFSEPLLDLPISDGAIRLLEQPIDGLLGEGPGAACAAYRAGITVDDRLHPIDGQGRAVDWLHGCGAVLGGGDPAVDGAGLGLAVFTGVLAGRSAAGVAG